MSLGDQFSDSKGEVSDADSDTFPRTDPNQIGGGAIPRKTLVAPST